MTLKDKTFLITGIADAGSLAMYAAKEILKAGGSVICTGLGVSEFHSNLSERATSFLNKTFEDFKASIRQELGDARVEILDVTLEDNVADAKEKSKLSLLNNGVVITNRNQFVENLLTSQNRETNAETELEDHLTKISFLEGKLKEINN